MNKKKGFALFFAIVIMSILTMVMSSLFAVTSSDLSLANTTADNIRAHYLAEAGLAKKLVELRDGNAANTNGAITLAAGYSGTYSVLITPLGQSGLLSYRLESTGTYNGTSKTISSTVSQISCAYYFYYFSPSPPIITSDYVIPGPFHTNSDMTIWGSPVFKGHVSSGYYTIVYYNGGPPADNPDFRGSLTLGAPQLKTPFEESTDLPLTLITGAQQPEGLYLTGDTTVLLLSDGTMSVTNAAKGWTNQIVPLPANKALYVDTNLNISGDLKGRLTAGAYRVYITNNIRYVDTNPSSTDMLALVADNNVYVASTAPNNLEIDAYIAARDYFKPDFVTIKQGTLTIYGGIAMGRKPDSLLCGYQTALFYYDTRLKNTIPDYFPLLKYSRDGKAVYLKTQWSEL